uniref:Uncharacterized protein n=1 Tax=Oryza rufipogon TaxID=4529 RepID=A0A0E0Q579_ORYRU
MERRMKRRCWCNSLARLGPDKARSRAPVGTTAFPSIGYTNREVVKARFDWHGEKIIEHELDRNGDGSLVIGSVLLLSG